MDTRPSAVPAFAFGAIGLGAWVIALAALLLVVPKHEDVFRDFGVALPGLTRGLIGLSRSLRGSHPGQIVPWIAIIAPAVLAAHALAVVTYSRWHRGMGATLLALLLVIAGLLITATFLGMYLPLDAMRRPLQGSP